MQNSARCVFPVKSVSKWPEDAVDQPRREVAASGTVRTPIHFVIESRRASSTRALARRANEHARKQIRQDG